jgi:hypothetical protein
MNIKRYAKVQYRTPRGTRSGRGKVIAIHETARGLWYEIKDDQSGETIRLRASGLQAAG